MKTVTRYELTLDGEAQGVGFIVGLNDTGLSETEQDTLATLFDDLPIPPRHVMRPGAKSWFTEAGKSRFAGAIGKVMDAYDKDGLFEVVTVEQAVSSIGEVIYRDEYQIIAI